MISNGKEEGIRGIYSTYYIYAYSPTHEKEDGSSNIDRPQVVTPTNGDSSEFIRNIKKSSKIFLGQLKRFWTTINEISLFFLPVKRPSFNCRHRADRRVDGLKGWRDGWVVGVVCVMYGRIGG